MFVYNLKKKIYLFLVKKESINFLCEKWNKMQKCVAELFLCLIEELCELLTNCSQKINIKIVLTISDIFNKFKSKNLINYFFNDTNFGIYSMRTQILPILQKWLENSKINFCPIQLVPIKIRNIKQCVGVLTQNFIDYIKFDGIIFFKI